LTTLAYAGGVALNSVANYEILRNTSFKDIYIQPAAGDAGGALGAALYVYYSVLKHDKRFIMNHAYYGPEYSESDIEIFLSDNNIAYKHFQDEDELLDFCAEELGKKKVIGWFLGKSEWGPRALGSRSIIADPRDENMKNIINVKVKFRESYRPFAPSVLAEKAHEYFEIVGDARQHYPLRFMLYVVPVKKNQIQVVPAITHVDGTARPQAVNQETNPRYWKLIKKFEEKTGIPMLINTSFNLKGEPIVTTPENAYSTFRRSGLDILVLGNFVVEKHISE